jgi:cyclopropane fatty-acyl-phospholipid synthase-like methyltransferase
MGQPDETRLPAPVVPATAYDEKYFREVCAGSDVWSASEGTEVAKAYHGMLAHHVRLRRGEVLVDLGTGRGELLAVALKAGARRAIGVEYSPAGVALARRTLEAAGVLGDAGVVLADVRAVPLPEGLADVVTMMEVVEHLAPAELDRALREAYRVLRPGGRIVLYTMPNRLIYDVTYRLQRMARWRRRRHWPRDPRGPYEHAMHVNEQTVSSLRRTVRRAGFRPVRARLGGWVYTDFVPDVRARRTYEVLARVPFLRLLSVGDIWAEGTRPPA